MPPALAALVSTLLWLAAVAGAATPPVNIPLGAEPSACATETSAECEHWTIERLNNARADEGLPAYALPASFTTLSPDRQLLILTDLDRTARDYTPVYGLNSNLSEAAQAGVREDRDPTTPATGGPWKGYGADWASPAALIGYYLWMYDDGYDSPNEDCQTPEAPGCWGHRKIILGEAVNLPQPQLMGAAAGTSTPRNAGSALIISSNGGTTTYYTWTQAQQEGAGASSEEPPVVSVPPEGPPGKEPATPPAGGSGTATQPPAPPASASGTPPRSEVLANSSAQSAQLAALLGEHLLPTGRAARIRAILRRDAISLRLPRGLGGTLVLDCHLGSLQGLLVARAERLLSGGAERLSITLTTAGRHLLRHRGSVALVLYASLSPAEGPAIRMSKSLLLSR
jgi:hypothetical protein